MEEISSIESRSAQANGERNRNERSTKCVKPICGARTRPCPEMTIVRKLVRVRLSSQSFHRCSLHQMLGKIVEKEPITSVIPANQFHVGSNSTVTLRGPIQYPSMPPRIDKA